MSSVDDLWLTNLLLDVFIGLLWVMFMYKWFWNWSFTIWWHFLQSYLNVKVVSKINIEGLMRVQQCVHSFRFGRHTMYHSTVTVHASGSKHCHYQKVICLKIQDGIPKIKFNKRCFLSFLNKHAFLFIFNASVQYVF